MVQVLQLGFLGFIMFLAESCLEHGCLRTVGTLLSHVISGTSCSLLPPGLTVLALEGALRPHPPLCVCAHIRMCLQSSTRLLTCACIHACLLACISLFP